MPFPTLASIPDPAALVADLLVPFYGLSPAATCRFHQIGLNDTYIGQSDSSKFALRIYRAGWRSIPQIEYELDALEYLAAKGAHVATPIRRTDGARISTVDAPEGPRSAVLFTFAPGTDVKPGDAACVDFGRACAHLHAAAEGFRSEHQRFKLDLAHLLDEPLAYLRPHLAHRPDDWNFLQTFAGQLRERLAAIDQSVLEFGFCHGDLHGGNVHRDGDRLTHFDFDCCGHGYRAYDVAVFRSALRQAGREMEAKRWPMFLSGYREIRPLSDADLAATALFVPIRDIWLMGVHLQGAPRWGFGRFGDHYFDFRLKFLRELQADSLDDPPAVPTRI